MVADAGIVVLLVSSGVSEVGGGMRCVLARSKENVSTGDRYD